MAFFDLFKKKPLNESSNNPNHSNHLDNSSLNEKVKPFMTYHDDFKASSIVNPNNVLHNFSDETTIGVFGDFFDYQVETNNINAYDNQFTFDDIVKRQADRIQTYRNVSSQSEVSNAIDTIVNEIIFCYEDFPLKIQFNEENEQLQDAVIKAFEKIVRIGKFDKNLFNFIRTSYIDGQMICHLTYDNKNIKKGIQQIRMLDPKGFYYDKKDNVFKYINDYGTSTNIYYNPNIEREQYDIEEIVRNDFGLYENSFICLSYLEAGIKTANMLKNLEDLLIPLRFSRSIARRVFNVDIASLPGKKGEEYLKALQNKFKYKSFYNCETGEIENQQHVTSMVEDYWFANRSGGRGTQVDTIDETGNLGEITDILYFNKKLYRALHIPTSRLDIDPDSDHSFSSEATEATQEDVKFMAFISRIRTVYCEFFKDILKREIIATGVMKDKIWNERQHDIKIEFTNENLFIEKMKLLILQSKIEIWNDAKELGGTVYTFSDLMQRVFGMNERDIQENANAVNEEIVNPFFKKLYEDAGFEIPEVTEPEDTEPEEFTDFTNDYNKNPDDLEDDENNDEYDDEDSEDSEGDEGDEDAETDDEDDGLEDDEDNAETGDEDNAEDNSLDDEDDGLDDLDDEDEDENEPENSDHGEIDYDEFDDLDKYSDKEDGKDLGDNPPLDDK